MNKKLQFFLILIIALCVCGCTESSSYESTSTQTSYQPAVQQQTSTDYEKIISEYEKHANTFDSDADNLLLILNDFDRKDKAIVRNNEVTLSDIYELTNTIEEYNYEYRKVRSHLESFIGFINRHQDELEEVGVDVFTFKQGLNDYDIELQNSQDRMISRTEYYIDYLALQEEYNRQQKEDLMNLLVMLI